MGSKHFVKALFLTSYVTNAGISWELTLDSEISETYLNVLYIYHNILIFIYYIFIYYYIYIIIFWYTIYTIYTIYRLYIWSSYIIHQINKKLPCIAASTKPSPLFRFRKTFTCDMTGSKFLVHRRWIKSRRRRL